MSGTRLFSTRAGLNLAGTVVEAAAPARGTVLLLHGGGQTRHSWKRAGRGLAAAGWRAVAIDHRGHGDSDWHPDGIYDMTAISEDAADVADALWLDDPTKPLVLVGASLGGLVGVQVAGWWGERLAGLVMVDIVPRTEPAGVRRILDFMSGAPDGFASLDEAAAAIADYLPHREARGVTPGLRTNLRQRTDGRWYWHWDPRLIEDRGLPFDTHPEHLHTAGAEVRCPVLLVRGVLSDVVSAESVREFAGVLSSAQVLDLTGAGHTAAADDNDAFTDAVLGFVDRLAPRPGRAD